MSFSLNSDCGDDLHEIIETLEEVGVEVERVTDLEKIEESIAGRSSMYEAQLEIRWKSEYTE